MEQLRNGDMELGKATRNNMSFYYPDSICVYTIAQTIPYDYIAIGNTGTPHMHRKLGTGPISALEESTWMTPTSYP